MVRPDPILTEPDPKEHYDQWLWSRTQNWIKEFQSVFGQEGEWGRNRLVFFTTNYVYKIPLNMEGLGDNDHEALCQGGTNATCWIEEDADGIPILIMERVTPVQYRSMEDAPSWVLGVDCMQVGYSILTGRLVAFDFGCH